MRRRRRLRRCDDRGPHAAMHATRMQFRHQQLAVQQWE
ncbi:hypothetical protein PXO_05811 [Xanthomonas oryzae pv. oryzae PXO99A]|uniref:Uncharacterized protein n=1 Tax=Xanthomonas oryzae pv. oryzae (strain PXO99A) TaxID=360094 RepID=A0A0K0GGD4_XANOP|nr:hypothetical protein PXO_05811 [Xanthomonas oryzae pv. oryzae PXO99A]